MGTTMTEEPRAQQIPRATQLSLVRPERISRCIRNMSRLTGPSTGTGDGGERVDPVMQLAQAAPDANTLAGEIVSRMNLQGRRRRELWYGPESGREPLVWLEDVFRQVNNGRHPEFSIPRAIEVMIPEDVLGEEIFEIAAGGYQRHRRDG